MFLKNSRKKFFAFGRLLLVMFCCVTPLIWLNIAYPDSAKNIGRIVAENPCVFTSFRWMFILAVFLLWPSLMAYYGNNRSWSLEKITFWKHKRLKVVLWLILFELIVCENTLLTAMHLIEGRFL